MRDGGLYEGEFLSGEITGEGTMKWPNGSTYTGQFFEGEKHNQGVLVKQNGDTYDGEWHYNDMHGKGTYTKKSGEVMVGVFRNNKLEGYCEIDNPNLNINFKGNCIGGLKNGQGKLENLSTGETYEGEWVDD